MFHKFKFRAECCIDAGRMYGYLAQIHHLKGVSTDMVITPCPKGLPDVSGEFSSPLTLTEIRKEIWINAQEHDLHVLYESLDYAEDYTGERFYLKGTGVIGGSAKSLPNKADKLLK